MKLLLTLLISSLLAFCFLGCARRQETSKGSVENAQPKHQPQSSFTIDEARVKLEQSQSQLLQVEREGRAEIERTISEQVNTGPKGEFETTREYEARKAKARRELSREQREQIEERANRKKETRRDAMNRRINEILVMGFTLPFEAQLGTYDADTQRFPLIVLPESRRESLFVPRPEARELKEKFSQAEKIGIFALHLDAQNRAKEYLLSGNISYRGRHYQTGYKEMDVRQAMFMLYRNDSSISNRAKWRGEAARWEESEAEYQALEAIPTFSKVFRENNTNKFILVTGSVSEGKEEFGDCHACGVKIGMAVFCQKDNIWRMEVGQKDIGTYGNSGIPPKASLVKPGMDRFAVKFLWRDMAQGVEGAGVDLIDRIDGTFKEILSIQTSEDTGGAGDLLSPEHHVSYNSRIEYVTGSHPTYFDIKVTTKGKKGVSVGGRKVMRPFVEVKIYKFSDGAYRLSG